MANDHPSHASTLLLHQLQASVAQIDAERLEAIPHQVLQLTQRDAPVDYDRNLDAGTAQSEVTLFAGVDEDGAAQMTLYVAPGMGQQARYLDLKPSEARELIGLMSDMANKIEEIVAC